MHSDDEDTATYIVLMNDEEQHSLWPSFKSVPAGWRVVRGPGSKQECMDYVDEVWKDITPLSVRRSLSGA